ncbi:hypothetical protein BDE02_18G106200 [Populus trichocarpa]|nr:hypothetical protein BDE02_18G106200 [Populus trichocarpa]
MRNPKSKLLPLTSFPSPSSPSHPEAKPTSIHSLPPPHLASSLHSLPFSPSPRSLLYGLDHSTSLPIILYIIKKYHELTRYIFPLY